MKVFEVPLVEIVLFGETDIVVSSPCDTDCICVECLPCAEGDHCTYYDTCPAYCARDGQ